MSNNEVRELLKTKYDRDVADITYRKFKANLNLTKNDFLETPCYCCDWNKDGKSFCFGCADSMVKLKKKKK